MGKAQTPALGASIVRSEIRAKIARMKNKFDKATGTLYEHLAELDEFVFDMAERSQKRPGGLGRKRK